MRKSILKDGSICLSVTVHFDVTKEIYSLALRNHFYRQGDPFPPNLSRPQALKILKAELKEYGENEPLEIGTGLEFEAETALIARLHDKAEQWVTDNYPFLTGPINNK
jgi:hypothetical protein